MTARIHIDVMTINREAKTGEKVSPIVIERDGERQMARSVRILGPCTVSYDFARRPEPRCFIETDSQIEFD
jgi:hypothetical protein